MMIQTMDEMILVQQSQDLSVQLDLKLSQVYVPISAETVLYLARKLTVIAMTATL